ncbi:hypothetical protein GCM10010129_02560 [Streptomyces fumigatiscleroticus]|nr:hypothetical protein GCM10010129_02560 [Streptomyces fumigatiscleroticus]
MAGTHGAAGPDRLSIVRTSTEDITVVTVLGQIDLNTAGRLRAVLLGCPETAHRIVVDLGQVTFMDCSGVNVLIDAHHAVHRAGGWLRLAVPAGTALRVLRIVGLDTVVDCYPTLRQALGS